MILMLNITFITFVSSTLKINRIALFLFQPGNMQSSR